MPSLLDAIQPFNKDKLWDLCRGKGRIKLCLRAINQGSGILCQLVGGEWHIGAVAISAPKENSSVLGFAGHKEDELALKIADKLSNALNCPIAICTGIHFDSISQAEIAIVQELADELASDFIACHGKTITTLKSPD